MIPQYASKKPWHFLQQRCPVCIIKPNVGCQNKATGERWLTKHYTHKPATEHEDLEKLKNGETLSLTQPLSLLRSVWFHISLYWCRRGFEGQRRLKKSSYVFGEDANGSLFAPVSQDKTSKNHPGGDSDVESNEKKKKKNLY